MPDGYSVPENAELYAINALPPDETARFERAWSDLDGESYAAVTADIVGTREALARLSALQAVEPPAQLRARIVNLANDGPESPPIPIDRHRRRLVMRMALAAAAAVILVVGGVAVGRVTVRNPGASEAQHGYATTLSQIMAASDGSVRRAPIAGTTGTVVVAWSRSHNDAVVVVTAPAPTDSRVYQLWLLRAGVRPHSAGIITGTTPSGNSLTVGQLDGAGSIGVTVEPAGGSPQPTTAVLAVVTL